MKRKTEKITIRITAEDKELLCNVANRCNLTLTDLILWGAFSLVCNLSEFFEKSVFEE